MRRKTVYKKTVDIIFGRLNIYFKLWTANTILNWYLENIAKKVHKNFILMRIIDHWYARDSMNKSVAEIHKEEIFTSSRYPTF